MGRLGEEKLLFCAKKHCPIITDDNHEDNSLYSCGLLVPQEAVGSFFSKSFVWGISYLTAP